MEENQDYLGLVIDAIGAVPPNLLPEMYRDFRNAGESEDVKNIIEVIATWVSTGEFHMNPEAIRAFEEADSGVADWSPLEFGIFKDRDT